MNIKSLIVGIILCLVSTQSISKSFSYSLDADIGYVYSTSDELFYQEDIIFNSLIKANYKKFSSTIALETIDHNLILNTFELDYNIHDKFYIYGGKIGNSFGLQPVYLSGSVPSADRAITNPSILRNIRSSITISEAGLGFKYIDSNIVISMSYFSPENITFKNSIGVGQLFGDGDARIAVEENTNKIKSNTLDIILTPVFSKDSIYYPSLKTVGATIDSLTAPIIEPLLLSIGVDLVDILTTTKTTTIENREDAITVNFSYSGKDYNLIIDGVLTQSKVSIEEEGKENLKDQLYTTYGIIGLEKFFKTRTTVGLEVMYINPENNNNSVGYNSSIVQEINGKYMLFANYAIIYNDIIEIEETNIGLIRNFSDIGLHDLHVRLAIHEQFNKKSSTVTLGYSFK